MVKPGYKQTEIGAIPEEWKVVSIGDIAVFQGGSQPPIHYFSSQEQEGYIRLVQIRDYKTDKYLTYIPENLAKRFCTKEDIMIGRYGPPIFQILRGIAGAYNVALIKAIPRNVNRDYLYYVLKNDQLYEYIELLSRRSSGQTGVDLNGLREYRIGLPSDSDQRKIADALADCDKLISNLEKLVSKKKAIKQGAMQELLTGKKRLPGFDGRWIAGKWKDVLEGFSSGATPYRGNSSFYNGTIKWVSSGELNYNRIFDTIEHISQNAQIKTNLSMHPAGTFLMAITGLEAAGTRGSCAILGSPATTNQSCMAIYGTERMSTEYLFHYYVHHGDELAFQYCQGTKQQSYTAAIVKELPIYYPEDVREQNAIASLLTDMDNEIEELKQKLDKYRLVKQGMMQQLLTGKIRLV